MRCEVLLPSSAAGLMMQGRYQIKPRLPYVLGGEIAGVVDAVGSGVSRPLVDERVVTWQLGEAWRKYVVVDAADVDVVPDGLAMPIAAAILVDYQTAHYALVDRGRLTAADTVLVLGAGGGVASAAIALAVQAGARVIAAASSEFKREAACGLGAVAAIDYSLPDCREALRNVTPEGVDVVLDPVSANSRLEPPLTMTVASDEASREKFSTRRTAPRWRPATVALHPPLGPPNESAASSGNHPTRTACSVRAAYQP